MTILHAQPQDELDPRDAAKWLRERARALLEDADKLVANPTADGARKVAFYARSVERVAHAMADGESAKSQGRLW
jgi:hypothetical protein